MPGFRSSKFHQTKKPPLPVSGENWPAQIFEHVTFSRDLNLKILFVTFAGTDYRHDRPVMILLDKPLFGEAPKTNESFSFYMKQSLLRCQFIEKLHRSAPEGQNKAISQGSVNYPEYGRR